MSEVVVLVVVLGAFLVVTGARLASLEQRLRSVSRVERKLDALLAQAGVTYDPYGAAPAPVIEALRRGKKIEAIKHYRAATGAGLREAKEYVDELERR
jgi:ribosomal protein L7/L12